MPPLLGFILKEASHSADSFELDENLNNSIVELKRTAILNHYKVGKAKHSKPFDAFDKQLFESIRRCSFSERFPMMSMMHVGEEWGDTWRSGYCTGVTHLHHFYTKRALLMLSKAYEISWSASPDIGRYLLFTVQQAVRPVNWPGMFQHTTRRSISI